MLNIPRVIRVLDIPFNLRVIAANEPMPRAVSDQDALGATDLQRHEIIIRGPEDQSTASAVDTLLHEVFHAVVSVTGMSVEETHEMVRRVTPVLLHTLRQNPGLVEALMTPYEEDHDVHARPHRLRGSSDHLDVHPEDGVPHRAGG